ncbi:hypothetical protein FKM82_007753 [Ascaphus truei]
MKNTKVLEIRYYNVDSNGTDLPGTVFPCYGCRTHPPSHRWERAGGDDDRLEDLESWMGRGWTGCPWSCRRTETSLRDQLWSWVMKTSVKGIYEECADFH